MKDTFCLLSFWEHFTNTKVESKFQTLISLLIIGWVFLTKYNDRYVHKSQKRLQRGCLCFETHYDVCCTPDYGQNLQEYYRQCGEKGSHIQENL